MPDSYQGQRAQKESRKVCHWTPAMIRVILDCVDEAAGEECTFITDYKSAIQTVFIKLRAVTDPNTYILLDEGKITQKVRHLSKTRNQTSFFQLLRQGTKVVNLSKLTAGTYTDAEIQVRGRDKQQPAEHPPSRGTKTNLTTKSVTTSLEEDASGAVQVEANGKKDGNPRKRAKLVHSSSPMSQVDNTEVLVRVIENMPDVITDEMPKSLSSDFESNETTRIAQSRTACNDEVRSRTMVVFVCEICDEEFQLKKLLRAHKLTHQGWLSNDTASRASLLSTRGIEQTQSPTEKLEIEDWVIHHTAGDPTDVGTIESEMADILVDILDATDLFLLSSKINGSDVILLQTDAYEDTLKILLRTIFGSALVDRPTQLRGANNSNAFVVRRREIMLTIIGCAVTEWVLRPLPQGQAMDGVLGEMNKLLQAQFPMLQDRLMEMATRQYLDKHVKPLAKSSAHVLAHELYQLLCHFLPVQSQESNSNTVSHISEKYAHSHSRLVASTTSRAPLYLLHRSPNYAPSAYDGSWTVLGDSPETSATIDPTGKGKGCAEYESVSDQRSSYHTPTQLPARCGQRMSTWPPQAQNHLARILLENLQHVFESASLLRLDMEMKGNAKYEFRFPLSGIAPDLK